MIFTGFAIVASLLILLICLSEMGMEDSLALLITLLITLGVALYAIQKLIDNGISL